MRTIKDLSERTDASADSKNPSAIIVLGDSLLISPHKDAIDKGWEVMVSSFEPDAGSAEKLSAEQQRKALEARDEIREMKKNSHNQPILIKQFREKYGYENFEIPKNPRGSISTALQTVLRKDLTEEKITEANLIYLGAYCDTCLQNPEFATPFAMNLLQMANEQGISVMRIEQKRESFQHNGALFNFMNREDELLKDKAGVSKEMLLSHVGIDYDKNFYTKNLNEILKDSPDKIWLLVSSESLDKLGHISDDYAEKILNPLQKNADRICLYVVSPDNQKAVSDCSVKADFSEVNLLKQSEMMRLFDQKRACADGGQALASGGDFYGSPSSATSLRQQVSQPFEQQKIKDALGGSSGRC